MTASRARRSTVRRARSSAEKFCACGDVAPHMQASAARTVLIMAIPLALPIGAVATVSGLGCDHLTSLHLLPSTRSEPYRRAENRAVHRHVTFEVAVVVVLMQRAVAEQARAPSAEDGRPIAEKGLRVPGEADAAVVALSTAAAPSVATTRIISGARRQTRPRPPLGGPACRPVPFRTSPRPTGRQ
jgi:hypothetical protein